MKIDFWFPNFGLQAAKPDIFNIKWFAFQKIRAIGFWTKFRKCDDIIRKYDVFPKILPSYDELMPHQVSSQ